MELKKRIWLNTLASQLSIKNRTFGHLIKKKSDLKIEKKLNFKKPSRRKNKKTVSNLKPGSVLILLSQKLLGKKVILINTTESGLLVVTGPFSLNGISLLIELNDFFCEKYYNKYKCIFNTTINNELIEQIKIIEENILKNANLKKKTPQYKIYEQLKNGNFKIITDIHKMSNNLFMLKISGIWENDTEYGLTYKFIKLSNPN
jgi:hypothetical protein